MLWGADIPLGVVGTVAVGTVYVGLVVLGQRRITVSKRGEVASWLAGLAVAGFAWLWFVQQSPPAEYGLSRSVFVLHDPGASGYFTVARNEADDVSRFLGTYEARMVEGDVFHVGTHPPGLFLLHRGLLATCEWSPTMTSLVNATQPVSVLDTFESINTYVRSNDPLTESEQAALWLGVLLTQAVAVAALLPLYLLVRQTHSRSAAWMAAAFWPLTPALAVFLPKSDALYPFLGLLFLWLWQEGLLRRRGWMCALAGLTMWAGLLMSLALLPVALFAVLRTGWGVWKHEADEPPRRFVATATTWAGGRSRWPRCYFISSGMPT